jgi:hypothetical protein
MPVKDAAEINKSGAYRAAGTLVKNLLQYIDLVTAMK